MKNIIRIMNDKVRALYLHYVSELEMYQLGAYTIVVELLEGKMELSSSQAVKSFRAVCTSALEERGTIA